MNSYLNMMIKNFFTLVILLTTSIFFAQIDGDSGGNTNGSGTFSSLNTNATTAKRPQSLNFDNENGYKTANEDLKKERQKQQQEEDLKNKGILTKAKIAEEQYHKNFKKINGIYDYPIIDQNLGSIRTKSKLVNIACRDFQYPDGDKVTIFVNDLPVVVNLILKQNFQSFTLPLDPGINHIKILALNQGSSGPNTAAFKIYNDAGVLLTSNEWNLATGAKATMIIANEEK